MSPCPLVDYFFENDMKKGYIALICSPVLQWTDFFFFNTMGREGMIQCIRFS